MDIYPKYIATMQVFYISGKNNGIIKKDRTINALHPG